MGCKKKHVKSVRDQTNKSRSTTDTYNSILWGHCHHTYRGYGVESRDKQL